MGGIWRDRNASQHRPEGHGKARQVLGGFRGSGHAALEIEAPAHLLKAILHLHGKIAVHAATHYAVVAHGPIAIEAEVRKVNRENVSKPGGFNVERPGYRISAEDARDALFVRSAGVDGDGVDGIAGGDREHGLIRRRELPVKNGRREIVALRRPGAARRNQRSAERMRGGVVSIVGVDEDDGPGEHAGLHSGGEFFRSTVLVFGQTVKRIAGQRSLQFVSAKGAREPVSFLGQFHLEMDGRAVEIGGRDPSARNNEGLRH